MDISKWKFIFPRKQKKNKKNKKKEKKKKKTLFSRHFIGGSAAPANTKRERERERVSE